MNELEKLTQTIKNNAEEIDKGSELIMRNLNLGRGSKQFNGEEDIFSQGKSGKKL